MSPERYAKHIGVIIGKNNLIFRNHWPSEPYLIEIGNNCQITVGVKFFTHGGAQVARKIYPDFDCFGKIKVEDWVYIGNNSLIMPGVTIGEGSIIAAGSVVTKSIPKGVVVGGNPAKYICRVDEYIQKNLKYNLNTKGYSLDKKRQLLLGLSDTMFINKPEIEYR